MTLGRKIFLFYILLFASVTGLFVHYYTPASTVVEITNTETKRSDNEGSIPVINPANNTTRDIYYISTNNEKDKSMMYRNEDTGWGFPWYIKFNSADLQAKASSIKESKRYAILVSYGWRFNVPPMFKNILSLKTTEEPDASTFSFYTIVTILSWISWLALIIVQTVAYVKLSRWREKREFGG